MTPFYANYGFHPRYDKVSTVVSPSVPDADARVTHLAAVRTFLIKQLERARVAMKKFADQ
jgi:hypothetical protein